MRATLLRVLRWGFAVVVVVAAGFALRGNLGQVMAVSRSLHPRWSYVAAASGVMLATYGILVATWRAVLRSMGGRLSFGSAAYVWFVSSLARYVPGTLWAVGALAVMAQRRGVAAVTATSSALVMTIAQVFAGFAVALAMGATGLTLGTFGIAVIVVGALALLLAPLLLPRIASTLSGVLGRPVTLPRMSWQAVAIAFAGCAAAWLLYGLAFALFTRGIISDAPPVALPRYVLAYVMSYLAGFLSVAPPAGLGVADAAMLRLSVDLGIATAGQATVLTAAVRLWRTILEILPGALLVTFARGQGRLDVQTAGRPADSEANRGPSEAGSHTAR